MIDPFRRRQDAGVNFFIHDPITGEAYSRDPRNMAKKAEAYLASSGIADTAYFGPEAEFYIFDSMPLQTGSELGLLLHRLGRGRVEHRPRGEDGGQPAATRPAYKGGYFPVPPVDHYADLRDDDDAQADRRRPRRRARSPRGRHRRPG